MEGSDVFQDVNDQVLLRRIGSDQVDRKKVLDENDGDKDFESSDFDPLLAQPAKVYGPPDGYVFVADKLEDDVPMPPATK